MLKVNCPSCGVRLTASDEYIGQPVTCQKCETKFVLSKRWTNEPLADLNTGGWKSSGESTGNVSVSDAQNSATDGSLKTEIPAAVSLAGMESLTGASAASAADVEAQLQAISRAKSAARRGLPSLDGYVEARSVGEFFDFRFRRYLTPSILKISWLLILVAAFVWFTIVSYAYVAALMESNPQRDPDFGITETVAAQTSPFFLKSGVYLSSVILIVVSLMWIRVLFETIIVLFSMSNTLRTIELRNAGQDDSRMGD